MGCDQNLGWVAAEHAAPEPEMITCGFRWVRVMDRPGSCVHSLVDALVPQSAVEKSRTNPTLALLLRVSEVVRNLDTADVAAATATAAT